MSGPKKGRLPVGVVDDRLLQDFRDRWKCEICGKRGPVSPHHVYARGIGGGSRVDIECNLLSACIDCHSAVHAGLISRQRCWEIIGKRLGKGWEECRDAVHAALRTFGRTHGHETTSAEPEL